MKKFDKIYLLTFLIIIGICSLLTGQHHTITLASFKFDTFYISLFASVIGVLYVIGVRLNNKYSMLLGTGFSVLYCILALSNKNYGDFSVNLYCAVVTFTGFFNWKKSEKNKSELLSFNKKEKTKLFILVLVVYSIMLYVLNLLGTNNLMIDALIASLVIFANTLMSMKYKEMWLFFNLLNALHCILWSIRIYEGVPNSLPILVMYVLYLSNSIIASYNLKKGIDK